MLPLKAPTLKPRVISGVLRSAWWLPWLLLLAFTACSSEPGATPGSAELVNGPGEESVAVSPTATPAGSLDKPAYRVPAEKGKLQEIENTPASPYFVQHPAFDSPTSPTVVFLTGGSGSRRSAQRAWSNYLSAGAGVDEFRLVLPYSVDFEYIDEAIRTFRILDEVLACYGGDAGKVHLGGVSNGGLAAFAVMLARPHLFATLLGTPGAFPRVAPPAWTKALAGRAVFNGVGANDGDWQPEVKETHDALAAAGIESVYVEFAGEGHIVGADFDESVFFDFWAKH
jgi:predicted esterase